MEHKNYSGFEPEQMRDEVRLRQQEEAAGNARLDAEEAEILRQIAAIREREAAAIEKETAAAKPKKTPRFIKNRDTFAKRRNATATAEPQAPAGMPEAEPAVAAEAQPTPEPVPERVPRKQTYSERLVKYLGGLFEGGPRRQRTAREAAPADLPAEELVREIASARPEEIPPSPIPQDDYEDFKARFTKDHAKDGLGSMIGAMESKIPGFADMEPGVRMLAVEALTNRLYAEVKTRGEQEFSQKFAGKRGMWNTVKNTVRYGLRKNYLTSKYEKNAYTTLTTNELDSFVTTHSGIVRTLAEKNPNVRLHADGKTVLVDYIGQALEDGKNEPLANEFNRRAKILQSIPKEWTYADSKPAERRAYKKALKDLEAVQPAMLAALKERYGGDESKAAFEMAKARKMIDAMSFLSQNPEAGDALRRIATRSEGSRVATGIARYWSNKYSGKNLKYYLAGAGIRFVAGTSIVGMPILGVPVAALVAGKIGAWRGKDIAKEGFRKEAARARAGERAGSQTLKSMSRVTIKTHQLQTLSAQLVELAASGSPADLARVRNQLATNLEYVARKYRSGEINFGSEAGRFANQYALVMAMHEAEATLDTVANSDAITDIYREALAMDAHAARGTAEYADSDARRRALLGTLEEGTAARVGAAREREIKRQAIQGAKMGALFGSLGALTAETAHLFGHLQHHAPSAAPHAAAPTSIEHIPAASLKEYQEYVKSGDHSVSYTEWLARRGEQYSYVEELNQRIEHMAGKAAPHPAEHVSPAPRLMTVDDIAKHSIAHADASAKGAEDMLLAIKHSKGFARLSPKQQEFFSQHSIDEIAKETKLYRPDDLKESVLIPKGSSIEITDDGHMYLVDSAHGQVHDIGVLDKDTGLFKASQTNDMEYMHAGHGASHEAARVHGHEKAASPASESDETPATDETEPFDESRAGKPSGLSVEELMLRRQTPEELGLYRPTPEALASHAQPVSPDDATLPDNFDSPEYGASPDPEAYVSFKSWGDYDPTQFMSPEEIAHASARAVRHSMREVNRFFGRHNFLGELTERGVDTPLWHDTMQRISGEAFLNMRTIDYPTHHFRPFFRHIEDLAERYPDVDRTQPFPMFMHDLYLRESIEHVARKDHVAP